MREVRAEIEVAAAPQAVLSAFTEVDAMREWWGVDRGLVERRVGGVWALTWEVTERGFRYAQTGVIQALRPGELLHIGHLLYLNPERPVLGPMELTVVVVPQERFSRLTVCQTGYKEGADWDWYYSAVTEAWPRTLPLVKQYLE
jgi:uncharacterized protein YndB with AHSA1/START domain